MRIPTLNFLTPPIQRAPTRVMVKQNNTLTKMRRIKMMAAESGERKERGAEERKEGKKGSVEEREKEARGLLKIM